MSSSASATIMDPRDGGAIPVMWIPCVVFAHLFACSFLLKMVSVMYPSAWDQLKRKVLCQGKRTSQDGTAPTAAVLSSASKGVVQMGQVQSPAGPLSPAGTSAVSTAYFDCETGAAPGAEQQAQEEGPPSSQGSEELLNKLTSRVHPLLMEWEEIGCSYNTSNGVKVVLQGIWGRAEPGDMVALMGPSGAGKSTLMDILAGRKTVGLLTGQVLVNKHRRRKQHFRKRTAYVPQDDNFLPTMTVWETCNFYASMLLPNSTNRAQRHERIKEVLAAMGLSHTMDTLVGGTLPGGIVLRGLSGGERKRLAIAQGVMSTPSILFLDEPTSGLDSFAALSVMSYMRRMATAGSQTVISSLHQPRAAIWALFDKAVLLSMGRMLYSGARDGMVPWFVERCGYPYDPAMHGLASDWVMDLVNMGFTKPEKWFGKMMNSMEELEAAADAFSDQYLLDHAVHSTAGSASPEQLQSPKSQGALDVVKDDSGSDSDHTGTPVSEGGAADVRQLQKDQEVGSVTGTVAYVKHHTPRKSWFGGRADDDDGLDYHKSAGWLKQCRILLWRELLSVTRNPADVAGRCLIFTWLAVFVGLIFYNLPVTVDALRARLNVLFVEPVILLLLPYVYMSLFTSDKQYFVQDVSAKLYRPSAYYVAKQLAVLPFAVLNSLLFAFTLYGLAGLRHDASAVGMNGAMSVLIYLIAAQVLTFTAVVMPNQDLAFMGAIAWTALNLLLSNFMVRYNEMKQGWFSQLRYLSAMGYAFDGYAQAEFTGVTYSCENGLAPSISSFLPEFLPNTPVLRSPVATRTIMQPGAGCLVQLDTILDYFNLHRPFGVTCAILLGYLGVLHIATFAGLMHLTKKEKR